MKLMFINQEANSICSILLILTTKTLIGKNLLKLCKTRSVARLETGEDGLLKSCRLFVTRLC